MNVFAVDQSAATDHCEPLWTSHLYCCGVAPPFGVAVNVIVVYCACGAGLLGLIDTADSLAVVVVGGGGVVVVVDPAVTGKSMLAVTSAASTVFPALRTHTPKRYALLALAGVQLNALLVVHSETTLHARPSCINHLYW